ncbi:MAG: AAA family ATPase, partial [Kiritimatiellae bacterium]|nr:AAA family ATPase [Kiritimatiellia bacterium]
MKIQKVELKNFRQFHGEQTIEFATDGEKNVTLVHAENTFGKTSLLNAVLWCLYGQVTAKFENPDKIVNFEAIKEGADTAEVGVQFEFNGKEYLVRRMFFNSRSTRDQTELYAYEVDGGNHRVIRVPDIFVNSVMPKEMAKYFFFDGEAAEAYSSSTNFKAISQAIRNILGCSMADTAIADLKKLCRETDEEIAVSVGDDSIKAIDEHLLKVGKTIDDLNELHQTRKEELVTFREQEREITDALRNLQAAKEIQARRDDKQAELGRIGENITECQNEIVKWIPSSGIAVVSGRLTKDVEAFVNQEEMKGRIPSPYNEDFVKSLLESGTCVCKRCLEPESKEWKAVASLLKKAGNAEAAAKGVRARARATMLKRIRSTAPEVLMGIQTKLGRLVGMRDQVEQEIAQLGAQMKEMPIKEIADRENALQKIQANIRRICGEIGGIKSKIAELVPQKEEYERQLERAARKNKEAQRLVNRRNLLNQSEQVLGGLLAGYEREAREEVEKEINDILNVVSHSHRVCRFRENFSIELLRDDGTLRPKSSGENQLLSLVFLAALVKFAAARIDKDDFLLKPG